MSLMTGTNAMHTPITGPVGCQAITLPASPTSLVDLCTVPVGAYSAVVDGNGGSFAFRLNGDVAAGPMLLAQKTLLDNPASIAQCILRTSSGGSAEVVVQFYSGTSGW